MNNDYPRLPPPPWEVAGFPALSQVFSYILFLPLILLRGLSLPSLPIGGASTYTNEESWEIQRGRDGRISGVTIHRHAEGS